MTQIVSNVVLANQLTGLKIKPIFFPNQYIAQLIPKDIADMRFIVYHKSYPDIKISVYLDIYQNLGYVGKPYWEIYPDVQGEPKRFLINKTEDLVRNITMSLDIRR